MKFPENLFKNHSTIIISCIVFLIIAFMYSYVKIGFLGDYEKNFCLALTGDSLWQTQDKDGVFLPHLSRYFPGMFPRLSVVLSIFLGVTNVKFLLTLYAFIVYGFHVVFLTIIYFNLPKDKKNIFDIILMSVLFTFFYLQYFILSEIFLTQFFIWVVFVIYFYIDFDKLSVFNSLSLILFSVFLISSYPAVVSFIPIFLFFGIHKYFKTHNINKKRRITLIASFLILLVAFIFNIFYIFFPILPVKSSGLSLNMLKDQNFIMFSFYILLSLFFSFFKKNRYKQIFITVIIIFSFLILNILLQIKPELGCLYRLVGCISPLCFMGFLICLSLCKIKINFIYIKTVNLILMAILLIGTLIYIKSVNNYNYQLIGYMLSHKSIPMEKFKVDKNMYKYSIYYAFLIKFVWLPDYNECCLEILEEDFNNKKLTYYINQNKDMLKFKPKRDISPYKFIKISR